MRRLLVAGALAAFGWLGSPASPASAGEDWVCVGIETIDYGYCQGDPLPELLPIRSECWNYFDPPLDQTCTVWQYVPRV